MQTGTQSPRAFPGPTDDVSIEVGVATLTTLADAVRDFGPIVSFNDSQRGHTVFVNDAGAVNDLLLKQHRTLHKGRDFERVRMLLGNGIIVNDGEIWRRHRRALQPAFTRRRLAAHVGAIDAITAALARRWESQRASGVAIDVNSDMSRYALDVILGAIFGPDHGARFAEHDKNPFRFLSEEFARDLRAVTRLRGARDDIRAVMAERRESGRREADFLDELLFGEGALAAELTDKEIIDEVMTLVVAGYETSAATLTFAWYELARRPELGSRVAAELAAAEARAAEPLEWLGALPLTTGLLRETLRWYPPVWLFSRRTTAPTEIDGVTVGADTNLMLSPYLLHRAAAHWPDADSFRPERFIDAAENPAYIPFSLGPRRCIGEYFAMLEMARHLRVMLARFVPAPASDTLEQFSFGINLRPGEPVTIALSPRQPHD